MTRVLHLLGTALPDSASVARIVATLAGGMDRRAYELHACFLNEDGPLRPELERSGVRTSLFPWTDGLRSPAQALRFATALRRHRFDILHQHTTGRAPRIMARLAGVKSVLHLHWLVVERDLRPAHLDTSFADAVVATSRAVAAQADGGSVEVIYPGVDVPEFAVVPASKAGMTIGYAGRLAQVKGVSYLLQALSELRQEFPALRLEIAGSGPERAALEHEAQSLRIAEAVSFLGWQSDVMRSLRKWDIVVLPSLHEGLGIAALEAMACGVPVVASSAGGLPELIEHGCSGMMVSPADAGALAGALQSLLRDPHKRRAMGEAGRKRVSEHFSARRMVKEITAAYERLLAGAVSSRRLVQETAVKG